MLGPEFVLYYWLRGSLRLWDTDINIFELYLINIGMS